MERPRSSRLKQLDGLRGLAALSVFLCHAAEMMINDPNTLPVWRPLRSLWDGQAAVVLFFVLSGFVLTLPYTGPRIKKVDAAPFIVRRLTRLYPAYWTAILLALFFHFVLYAPQGLTGITPWLAALWSAPISRRSLVKHFLLIAPGLHFMQIDPSIWSLAVEVKVSLVFPAVLFLVRKTRRVPYALLILAAVFGLSFLGMMGNFEAFLCGSYLARYKDGIVAVLRSSRWLRAGMVILGYAAYGASWSMPFLNADGAQIVTALGASVFIALFLSSRSLAALGAAPPVAFIGDASYSFYLLHLPVMLTVTSWLYHPTGSLLVSVAASLVCSLALSHGVYKFIELPTQNWGRARAQALDARIAAFLAQRRQAAPSGAQAKTE